MGNMGMPNMGMGMPNLQGMDLGSLGMDGMGGHGMDHAQI